MRIGIDIDGVMYKWDKTARYMLREVLPNSPYKEVLQQESSRWDWIKEQVQPEHWNWLWTEGVRLGLFRYGHLYAGTIQAVRTLAAQGHEVVLITHRPKVAVTDTLAWLGLLDLPISGLHLLTNTEPKSWVRPQCDAYLDDKPDNVVDLRANTEAKLVCMMRRPWNTMVLGQHVPGVVIVSDWDDFLQCVGYSNIKFGQCGGFSAAEADSRRH